MPERVNNIGEILNSFDGIKRAEAPAFLYTKIRARLTRQRSSGIENTTNLISNPVVVFSLLLLILLIDSAVLQFRLKDESEKPGDYAQSNFGEEIGITSEESLQTDEFEQVLFYDPAYNNYVYSY